jgi:hypothetical protein
VMRLSEGSISAHASRAAVFFISHRSRPRPEKESLLAAQPELNPLAHNFKENPMSLGTILLIVLILLESVKE